MQIFYLLQLVLKVFKLVCLCAARVAVCIGVLLLFLKHPGEPGEYGSEHRRALSSLFLATVAAAPRTIATSACILSGLPFRNGVVGVTSVFILDVVLQIIRVVVRRALLVLCPSEFGRARGLCMLVLGRYGLVFSLHLILRIII